MRGKFPGVVIAALLCVSVFSPLASAAHQSPTIRAPPVFVDVRMSPIFPIGAAWEGGSPRPLTNGDSITVYANITGADQVEFLYSFCNRNTCVNGEPYPGPWFMTYLTGNCYYYHLRGDYLNGILGYEAAWVENVASPHFAFSIIATNVDGPTVYPPGGDLTVYPAWPPSQVNVTAALSHSTVYASNNYWVNGTSWFWNSTSKPQDYTYLLRADSCPVTVTLNPGGYTTTGLTDANGDFVVEGTAPIVTGTYSATVTVSNATRGVSGTVALPNILVPTIQLTAVKSHDNLYPMKQLWVNGTAVYSNGVPLANSFVNVTVVETGAKWPATTNAAGAYNRQITNPTTYGAYTLRTEVKSAKWGDTGLMQQPLTVKRPVIKLSLVPDRTTMLVDTQLNFTGAAAYDNGEPMSGATVNVTVAGWGGLASCIAAANGSFHGTIPAPGSAGTFYLNATVKSGLYSIFGYNETPIVVVPIPIPDLTIVPAGITFTAQGGLFLENRTIMVKAVVWNRGILDAPTFAVEMTAGDGAIRLGSANLSLAVGRSATVWVNWTAVPGNHTVRVSADPTNQVPESLEVNNNATKGLFIDRDTDGDGTGNAADDDDDNDGYDDVVEEQYGSDPANRTSTPPDIDHDYIPDPIDPDMDGDGVANEEDLFPEDPGDWADQDGDGIGDNADDDIDGDEVPNYQDAFPRDPAEWSDVDRDGVGDNADGDIDGDGYPNWWDEFPNDPDEWRDYDDDGIGDAADIDDDNDGYVDDADWFPLDTDNDGLPNRLDLDDDADGIPDKLDQYPQDTDNDGLRNDLDGDDDGDGLADAKEDRNRNGRVDAGETDYLSADTDGDGIGDYEDRAPLVPLAKPKSTETTTALLAMVFAVTVLPLVFVAWAMFEGSRKKD
jgi:hypothetical protein